MRIQAFSRLASCAAFVTKASAFSSPSTTTLAFVSRHTFHSSTSLRLMSDELQKAAEAAKAYQSSDHDGAGPPTVFDKILSGEWSSDKLYEDDQCLAFRDISPQAPTHFLVIPKHRDGLTQLSNCTGKPEQKALLGHLIYVAQDLAKKECPEGFRIVINDGKDGAQSVYHLHVHVMGGRAMQWPPG